MTDTNAPRQDVQDYYRAKAVAVTARTGDDTCASPASTVGSADGACCSPGRQSPGHAFGAAAYPELGPAAAPDAALLASLGCGNPTAVAELREGETVLDLGSGGGLDVILSARRVGPDGRVYGLDFLEEMLALARRNVEDAQIDNVVLLKGTIEAVPLPAGSVDVVISNCVVNLSDDKQAVFDEIARVLAPGGRVGITDVVAEDRLGPAERAERGGHAQCIAGALSVSEYYRVLAGAGLVDAAITFVQDAADGMHSAIVKARKPTDTSFAHDIPSPERACC